MPTLESGGVGTELRRDAIGVTHIVFVVAAAAPLTAVVGASPAADLAVRRKGASRIDANAE
jgi:hypothetical protein